MARHAVQNLGPCNRFTAQQCREWAPPKHDLKQPASNDSKIIFGLVLTLAVQNHIAFLVQLCLGKHTLKRDVRQQFNRVLCVLHTLR